MATSKHKIIAASVSVATAMLAGGAGYVSLEGNPGAPYMDIGGIWTDCYGNTHGVNPNRIRSEKECRELLNGEAERLANLIYKATFGNVQIFTLASYISFSYNVGFGAFLNSTLLQKHLNGDYEGACKEMFRWVYVKKVYSPGLYKRRKVEYATCMLGAAQNV